MKKLLLLLALLPTMLLSQDIMEPVTFRLDINDIIEEIPNSEDAQYKLVLQIGLIYPWKILGEMVYGEKILI